MSLDEYLIHEKMTAQQLAAAVGVKHPTISNIRRGRYRPSPELAAKIEKITGIPLRRLLLPDEAEPAPKPDDAATPETAAETAEQGAAE